jgi:putative transposase
MARNWVQFQRGLSLVAESAAEFFPDAAWQRCVVHFYRNVFSHVPRPKMREVAAMLKAIHAAEDVQAAREKARQIASKCKRLMNDF